MEETPAAPPPKPKPLMEVGAVVWLKSGSPRMVVTDLMQMPREGENGPYLLVTVRWAHDGRLEIATLPEVTLTTVKP